MAAVVPAIGLRSRTTLARWDALLVVLAFAHGALFFIWPTIPLIAIGLWWNSNTISHNFIHRPFFASRLANSAFSCYLSLLLGFPQTLWRDRHLFHHAATGATKRSTTQLAARASISYSHLLAAEVILVLLLWGSLIAGAPQMMLTVYLPGFLGGLFLCYLQGHYEHATGTISHYGRFYNWLFFNDGYHCEHHHRPGAHWKDLPRFIEPERNESRWPAVLRWLDCFNLCSLERLVLRSRTLQRFVIARHELAMRRLLRLLPPPRNIAIVGGGLFPRTALILERLLPDAHLVLIDLSSSNLEIARGFLKSEAEYRNERFDGVATSEYDLLIVPLAFIGDRETLYNQRSASPMLVHDWIWRRRGQGAVVSWLLLKRLNLVTK